MNLPIGLGKSVNIRLSNCDLVRFSYTFPVWLKWKKYKKFVFCWFSSLTSKQKIVFKVIIGSLIILAAAAATVVPVYFFFIRKSVSECK
jgi:hypothetical protein